MSEGWPRGAAGYRAIEAAANGGGGSDHPIYTLRDLSVCVDPRSTGATGIPVRLVVLTTTAVKTGVAGPWGQADAQKKNYDVEFELNRLILATKPARRCRFTTQRVAKFG